MQIFITFTLEVAISVDTFRRWMTAVSVLVALVDIDTVVVSHLIARLAFAIIPDVDTAHKIGFEILLLCAPFNPI